VFSRGNPTPSTKALTFYRKEESFELEAHYISTYSLPNPKETLIGRFTINNVRPLGEEELVTVKVKVRVNAHGLVGVEGAYIPEEVIREEEVPAEDEGKPPVKKTKKYIKKHELPFTSVTSSLNERLLGEFRDQEGNMQSNDKLIADTEERKNVLEEYVYEMRGKIEVQYNEYVTEEDKVKLIALLNETEEWLYNEGEEATKSTYSEKLEQLYKLGNPITKRWKESQELPNAEKVLREAIFKYTQNANSVEERFSHISLEDRQQVIERCVKTEEWLDKRMQSQLAIPKSKDPVVLSQDLLKEREQVVMFCSGIMSKPKPKVEPEKNVKAEKSAEGKEEMNCNGGCVPEEVIEEAKMNGMDID